MFILFEEVACISSGNVISDVNILMREETRQGFDRLEWGRGLEMHTATLAHVVAELKREVCVFSLRSALVE